ncbi:hypothetical protein C4544_06530 [candidate division WS5 bacterium]|uniref:Uncharacterized protein n=1 Tax=candidate division WS5 bacterium TaxID=2093353 RepID=A0A419DA61_9BACT|nr:MAG: hypothetical protein C4544_06530 [candidate division WS5 bacterium]
MLLVSYTKPIKGVTRLPSFLLKKIIGISYKKRPKEDFKIIINCYLPGLIICKKRPRKPKNYYFLYK